MSTSDPAFVSDGFDLDAAVSDSDVLELGGGVSRVQLHVASETETETETAPAPANKNGGGANNNNNNNSGTGDGSSRRAAEAVPDPTEEAEALKARGNEHFTKREYEAAVEFYTKAIEATPGAPNGAELLRLEKAWKDEQDKAWRDKLAQIDQERRDEAKKERETTKGSSSSSSASAAAASKKDRGYPNRPKETFEPPRHPHGSKLAVYHGNRAAAYVQLQHYDRAVEDCDAALLLDSNYLKALVRRATAYEHLDKTDLALADVRAALERDPANWELRKRLDRLQKLEDERLERLKAETMDKLKDLGNSILGNFGLSIDNFKATQDPNTGSYSINFQQNT